MKLPVWMNRKFWKNSGVPLGEFAAGPTCNCLTVWPSPEERFDYFMPPGPENWTFPELPADTSLLFEDGLLSIGTFGSPVISPLEIAQKEVELQKVLAAESEKDKYCSKNIISSASKGSGKGTDVCPLQEFLLGLPVELVEEGQIIERRSSLGELFMRSRAEEVTDAGVHGMTKRMLKRRRSVNAPSGGGSGAVKCEPAEYNKFHKIKRIFNRKIHPENAAASKKLVNPSNHEEKEMFYMTDKNFNENGKEMDTRQKVFKREGLSRMKWHAYTESSIKGHGRIQEHWIKTDAEYLVLEL